MRLTPRAERRLLFGLLACAGLAFLLVFPPFHVRKAGGDDGMAVTRRAAANAPEPLDVPAFASQFWQQHLLAAGASAVDTGLLLGALQENAESAGLRFGRQAGLGGSRYFLVKGSGRVLRVEPRRIWLSTAAAARGDVYLVNGPIFGNALRDATGAADINRFSSFDFNALSAALNARSEANNAPVMQSLRSGTPVRWLAAAELDSSSARRNLKMIAIEIVVE